MLVYVNYISCIWILITSACIQVRVHLTLGFTYLSRNGSKARGIVFILRLRRLQFTAVMNRRHVKGAVVVVVISDSAVSVDLAAAIRRSSTSLPGQGNNGKHFLYWFPAIIIFTFTSSNIFTLCTATMFKLQGILFK